MKLIRKSGVVDWECAAKLALSLSHSAQSRSQIGLSAVRRCDGSSSLGQREKSADELVSRIPGDMGETHELSGSRHSLRHELAQLISCGSLGGWIGKLRELLKYDPRSVKAYLCERTSIGSGPPPSATRPRPGYRAESFCASGVCERTVGRSSSLLMLLQFRQLARCVSATSPDHEHRQTR